ncbi:uncharacterized protein HD556DRAFT_1410981 [Suillus plorans]|uniref:Uncharacterized protein n=1 Tax=Suillus plorans TaxID=116603 RepID=A0A9P7AEF1_9AGAM|nr:uncharacterized protein HD556DRAFT_1410981 [Suillus plorans]KAG1787158.1 hypothetical protein HD556DRAFT_1410981 [Suillus plorans]
MISRCLHTLSVFRILASNNHTLLAAALLTTTRSTPHQHNHARFLPSRYGFLHQTSGLECGEDDLKIHSWGRAYGL